MEERSLTLHDLIQHRGQTYRLMDRYDETLADFNQVIKLWPEADWIVAERQESTTSEPLADH